VSEEGIRGGRLKRSDITAGARRPGPSALISWWTGGGRGCVDGGTPGEQRHGGSRSAVTAQRPELGIGGVHASWCSVVRTGIGGDVVSAIGNGSDRIIPRPVVGDDGVHERKCAGHIEILTEPCPCGRSFSADGRIPRNRDVGHRRRAANLVNSTSRRVSGGTGNIPGV